MTFYVITTDFHGENSEIISFEKEDILKHFLISEIETFLHKSIIYNSQLLQDNESIYKDMSIDELSRIISELCKTKKKNHDIFSRFIFAIFNGHLIYHHK